MTQMNHQMSQIQAPVPDMITAINTLIARTRTMTYVPGTGRFDGYYIQGTS